MNLQYTVPNSTHRSILWLLFSVAILTTLLYALAAWAPVFQITPNTSDYGIMISAEDQLPQAMPVPAPPQDLLTETSQTGATPLTNTIQPVPVPQPVPTPPPGE